MFFCHWTWTKRNMERFCTGHKNICVEFGMTVFRIRFWLALGVVSEPYLYHNLPWFDCRHGCLIVQVRLHDTSYALHRRYRYTGHFLTFYTRKILNDHILFKMLPGFISLKCIVSIEFGLKMFQNSSFGSDLVYLKNMIISFNSYLMTCEWPRYILSSNVF